MLNIDLAALPPTVAELEAERNRLSSARQLYLAGGVNVAALLALAIGLAHEFTGFDLFMGTSVFVLALSLACLLQVGLLTVIRLDNLRPASDGQTLMVKDALQYLQVSRYMTHVQAQGRPLTGREAITIILYANEQMRHAAASRERYAHTD
ncbi:hypothetical protein [Burkholderia ubonensis]|uniref:hypothetical protein n=1 Tax=Burkholderia ubonensis TaxID=101571 RepID=UPI000757C5D0|nr:hypothetical protein [Burkholderia ubonensis]KVP17101.1 hypothetical protein WJ84_02150 [Burkholderia ubonensis]